MLQTTAMWRWESSLTILDFNFFHFKARVLDEVISKVSFNQEEAFDTLDQTAGTT